MKNYKIRWDTKAAQNLRDIHYFIKVKSPQGADNVVRDMLQSVEKIPFYPHKHNFDPHLGKPYRRVIVRHYLIIYKVDQEVITILDIFDARQSPTKKKEVK